MADWKRLGDAIVAQRVHLGHRSRESFAKHSRLSSRILTDLERGNRTSYDRATFARLEQALEWAAGSVQAILDGGHATTEAEARMAAQALAEQGVDPIAAEVVYVLSPGSPLDQEERDDFRMILDQLLRRYRTIIRQAGQDGAGK
jgi:hypothetical protein